jgi:hypothetical protein
VCLLDMRRMLQDIRKTRSEAQISHQRFGWWDCHASKLNLLICEG